MWIFSDCEWISPHLESLYKEKRWHTLKIFIDYYLFAYLSPHIRGEMFVFTPWIVKWHRMINGLILCHLLPIWHCSHLAKSNWLVVMKDGASVHTCRTKISASNTTVACQWVILTPTNICGHRAGIKWLSISVLENMSCWNVFGCKDVQGV